MISMREYPAPVHLCVLALQHWLVNTLVAYILVLMRVQPVSSLFNIQRSTT